MAPLSSRFFICRASITSFAIIPLFIYITFNFAQHKCCIAIGKIHRQKPKSKVELIATCNVVDKHACTTDAT
jgi:hypothetical protein